VINVIDISKLKKGDVFFKAQTNCVLECTMEDDEIQKFGSFSVTVKERGGKIGIISKEDYDYIFYSREEAEEARKSLPNEELENLLEGENWLEMLFYVYKTYMTDTYVEPMKKAIEIKTGLKVD
jgi:hypothetical protein